MGSHWLLANYLEVRMTSADLEAAFDLILSKGFGVYSVRRDDELTTCFLIKREDYSALKSLLSSHGEELAIYDKIGIYWVIKQLIKRPAIYVCAFLIFVLTLYIPTRILFLDVTGNSKVSKGQIIEAAEQCGIHFGANREEIRNENIKNRMLSLLPNIEWVGINTNGCVAYISVKEKGQGAAIEDEAPSNIVAARDAVISSIEISKGSSHCAVGDAVLKGQLLISGYTDCGKVLLQGRADGEVYGYTSRELAAAVPQKSEGKLDITKQAHRYSIVIGKKRINFWKGSGIWPATCDRIYQEYWLRLPGGYVLPVCWARETIRYYNLAEDSSDVGEDTLLAAMYSYLQVHMAAGSILHQDIRFSEQEGLLYAQGNFGCHEIIGRQKFEEIGETYG